ncbi:MAG: ubiquinone/menaquinone biosynthesis methyltransferase [Dehalococcoidia bacterium]|nr:MAG: ubiquinone/menaquinone biosynthesis methyltransferase [Dehalococcoidia bacterium]
MTDNADRDNQSLFLQKIYDTIPRYYGPVNTIITWGLDRQWRLKTAEECLIDTPEKVLDISCGTGELTMELLRKSGRTIAIIGVDFNHNMIKIAEKKIKKSGSSRVSFVNSNIENLPFPEEYFDSIDAAFAIRNMTYKNPITKRNITEVLRVLKKGGRFVLLETSQPKPGLIKHLYHVYIRSFISLLGTLIYSSRQAYNYLVDSMINYFSPEELEQFLLQSGFSRVYFYRLLFGAVSIHIAIK